MDTLETSVADALGQAGVDPRDQATAELALTYARTIDAGGDLAKLGPALLTCLAALGMTPAARAAAMKGGRGADPATRRLDDLAARRARKTGTADLDTAAP